MRALLTVTLFVLAADQAIKWLLRRCLRGRTVSLGALGRIRLIDSRLWLARAGAGEPTTRFVWIIWLGAAALLAPVTLWMPAAVPWVGVLLGGSMSHAIESSRRGVVSDYICFRFWPAFNLADVAITAGAIGTILTAASQTACAR